MPHLTTEELKKLREWITPEWKFEKGKALPGSIPSHDAALIAAAFEEVDSTPMEGFDPKAVDEILNLSARGLRSVAIMPLGYRLAAQDWLAPLKKVRRPREQFVTEVK